MGFFSLHETCSCCGGDTGFNKARCKDGYLCTNCAKEVSKKGIEFTYKATIHEIKEAISQKYFCEKCSKELKDDLNKFDGKYFCNACLKEYKSLQKKEIKQKKQEEYNQLQEKAKIFKEEKTANVEKYIYFNDKTEEIFIPDFWTAPKFLKYTDILDFELLEDGNTVSSGGVGRAVAGGLLFGGAGAVVGAVTGKHKNTGVVNSMKIKITTKDLNEPVIFIKIFKGEHKKDSFMYNAYQKDAHKILSMLQIVVDKVNQNNILAETKEVSKASVVDELKGLKELLDSGVLTQEEFDNEKSKILNR